MKADRTKVRIIIYPKEEDNFARMSPSERVSFIWELTSEIWSLRNPEDVK